MQNVFYWRDVYNASDKFTPYQEVIWDLLSGRCTAREKLRGQHNQKPVKKFGPKF